MSAFSTYVDTINKMSGVNIAVNTNYRLETRNKHKAPREKEGVVSGLSVSDREADTQGNMSKERQVRSNCWKD